MTQKKKKRQREYSRDLGKVQTHQRNQQFIKSEMSRYESERWASIHPYVRSIIQVEADVRYVEYTLEQKVRKANEINRHKYAGIEERGKKPIHECYQFTNESYMKFHDQVFRAHGPKILKDILFIKSMFGCCFMDDVITAREKSLRSDDPSKLKIPYQMCMEFLNYMDKYVIKKNLKHKETGNLVDITDANKAKPELKPLPGDSDYNPDEED